MVGFRGCFSGIVAWGFVVLSVGAADDSGKVEAVVNGQAIPATEVDGAFSRTSVAKQTLTDQQRRMYRAHVLNVLIDNVLLKQYLEHQKVQADSKAVDAHIAEFKAMLSQKGQSLEAFLAEAGATPERMRQEITDLHQWFAFVEKQSTQKNLYDYFSSNREAFDGSLVRASHILVEFPPTPTPEEKAAAYKKIQAIQAQLASGADFASLAKQNSDCQSKEQGGDVGYFVRKGKMTEPFAQTAFGQEVGKVSGIVETEYGYHLIKTTDKKAGNPVAYDDVSGDVAALYAADLRTAVINVMRKNAQIKIDRPAAATAVAPSQNTQR